MSPDAFTTWRRNSSVAFVDNDKRIAVLALDTLDELGARLLEGPAAAIWRAVGDGSDEGAIADTVAQGAGVDIAVVTQDVHGFLADLEAHGLVVRT